MANSVLWTPRVGLFASTFPHLRWRTLLLCISCSQGCKKKVEYVLLGRRRQSLGVGTFRIFCQIFQSAKQCMRPNSEEQLCGLAETSVAGVAQICTSQQTSELLLCTLKCFACSPSLQENNYGLTFSFIKSNLVLHNGEHSPLDALLC